jgi:hypothetical protein
MGDKMTVTELIHRELRITERLITQNVESWGISTNKWSEDFWYQTISGYRYAEEALNRVLKEMK